MQVSVCPPVPQLNLGDVSGCHTVLQREVPSLLYAHGCVT